jgi:hypothetical protein
MSVCSRGGAGGKYSQHEQLTALWKKWEQEPDVLLIREEAGKKGDPVLKFIKVEFVEPGDGALSTALLVCVLLCSVFDGMH